MPTSQMILSQLARVSNAGVAVAIGWHVVTAAVVVALMLGWRPSRRASGLMLAAPIATAAAAALVSGNPFNGSILGLLTLALVLMARRLGPDRVTRQAGAWGVAGIGLIAFGSFYPHFLGHGTPLAYLYAAPTGLIPCPTLSLVIGFSLVAGGLGSRVWCVTLAVAGLFYGLFGVARLGVTLDAPLLVGAAALLFRSLARKVPGRALARA